MRCAYKTLLLWLLLVVLPVQGIAAAAMTSCQALPHHEQGALQAVTQHHADHPDAIAQHDHHDAVSAVMAAHDHPAHHHHDGKSTGKHDASSSCSACAACCIGAAPLPAALNWAVFRNASEPVFILPPPFMTGFIPAGLERPPRPATA